MLYNHEIVYNSIVKSQLVITNCYFILLLTITEFTAAHLISFEQVLFSKCPPQMKLFSVNEDLQGKASDWLVAQNKSYVLPFSINNNNNNKFTKSGV